MTLRKFLKSNVSKYFPNAQRLWKDDSGIAAIEFAFIAPLMIGMYFGMTELAMAITADRNVAQATSVAGDLATQVPTMNEEDIEDIMTATIAVLGVPSHKLGDLSIELNSYQMASDGTINSVGYALLGSGIVAGGPATYDPSGLSTQMFNAQSGVVVARVNFKHTPVTFNFFDKLDDLVMAETFVMKPRKSISVPFDEGGDDIFTCTAATALTVSCSHTSS